MNRQEASKKKTLLIADDDEQVLESLTEFLKPFQHLHHFEILTAQDGAAAIAIIDASPVDLLITDLNMPKADGFRVISHLIGHSPATPVVVMTAYGSPETEKKLREMENVFYVEKPIEFNKFISTILELLAQDRKGKIEGISISILLQLLEMEKTTCTLQIASANKTASLYLKNGALIEAETATHRGKEAALEILNWDNVRIDLKKTCKVKIPTISVPLTEILLESFRLKDELSREEQVEVRLEEEKESEKKEQVAFFHAEDFGLELEKIENMVEYSSQQPARIEITTDRKRAKEEKMDIPKLMKAIDTLKENLGGALISTDIFSSEDAQPIAGWNSNPAACAVFGQFTTLIGKSLKEVTFPEIGRYYLLDLVDKKIVVVIPMGDYQWVMLIDGRKTQLGLILNLAIPKAIGAFEEALAG